MSRALTGLALLKAKHNYENARLVVELTNQVVKKETLKQCEPDILVTVLDALARLGVYDRHTIERITTAMMWTSRTFRPTDIAHALDTLTRFGWHMNRVVDTLGLEIMRKAIDFKPDDIALVVKALDKLYGPNDHRANELLTRLKHPKPTFVENPMPFQGYRRKKKLVTLQEVTKGHPPIPWGPAPFRLTKIPPRKAPAPEPEQKDDLDVIRGFFG